MSEIQSQLNELNTLLSSPALAKFQGMETARMWRNEVNAGWIDSLAERLNRGVSVDGTPQLVNEKTGKIHTVESMVEELRERVKLDTITKSAAAEPQIHLTAFQIYAEAKKKDHALKESVETFVSNFVSSHRGYVSKPAVLFALRDKFDNSVLLGIDGWVRSIIDQYVEAAAKEQVHEVSYRDGEPLKLDLGEESSQPLFPNIKNV